MLWVDGFGEKSWRNSRRYEGLVVGVYVLLSCVV